MSKILFLCNRIPNNENAGGILFHNIMKTYGINKFHVISISQKLKDTEFINEYVSSNVKQFSVRIPNHGFITKIIKKLPIIEPVFLLLKLSFVKRKIISLIKDEDFDMIFAPLRGDVFFILKDILMEKRIPLISMIEDTVEREIDDHRILYKKKKARYYKALNEVQNLAVPGETMQGYFENNFNLKPIILRPSYQTFSGIDQKIIENNLNIFFSGNLYAKNETLTFISALTEFSQYFVDYKIKIYVASHIKLPAKNSKIEIINLGWLNEDELKKYMNICHISYLPYKFEEKFAHSMKYAFPGKAGFYITNNLPIFFHGPDYSSFNEFLKKYRVGVSCSSLNKFEIVELLKSFITNESFYKTCQHECLRAFNEEYNNDIFKKRVIELFTLKK